MTATRTDQHRPAEFVPEDYYAVGYYYSGTPQFLLDDEGRSTDVVNPEYMRMLQLLTLVSASTTTRYHNGDQCDHCGNRIRYVVVVKHLPTGDHLAIGEQCADGRFTYSTAEFKAMHGRMVAARKEAKKLEAWNAYKADHPADWDALITSTNSFVQDVLRKGRQYGSLSDRQFDAICKAVVRDAEREEVVPVPKVACPVGRVDIEGRILTFKTVEGYGYNSFVTKMLVLVTTPCGEFKVWGSLPRSLDDAERGDIVRFSAEVQRSSDDESFGFYKRPTKASIKEIK
jgi:hypothetical protein